MKTKYLDKKKWRRIMRSKYDEKIITYKDETFLAGLIHMHKVREPLSVPVVGEDTLVVANNFKWLQVLPENRNYSMTVMYDEKWREIQYYFDINYSHTLELGKARREDLYLDVLVLPDGRYELVDEEDIKRALRKGIITAKESKYAYNVARELMSEIDRDFTQFKELSAFCLKELKKLM